MALALEDEGQSKAIAAEWAIDPSLLDEADWELESIDSNDGFTVGYFVRFSEDTDRELLDQLGVSPGEFHRELSMNAFDQPDDEEEYERYRAQHGDDRRRIADRDPGEWGNIMNDFARGDGDNAAIAGNGATFAGSSFAGNSFAVADDGISSVEEPLPGIGDGDDDEFELTEPSKRPSIRERQYNLEDQQITAVDFRELHPARRIEVMLQWFHDHYEDPAVRTPYESAEGGYQWIWGGPYDAREQIGDEFSDIADEDEIEAAVDEVEKDGLFDWAPKESPDDYDQPDETDEAPPRRGSLAAVMGSNFGSANFSNLTFEAGVAVNQNGQDNMVAALKAEMLDRLDGLEALIRQQMSIAPNRGHNQPPELLEAEPAVTQAQFEELVVAIAEVRKESESPEPQIIAVVEKISLFRRIANFIKTGPGYIISAAASGVIGDVAVDAYKAHQHQIYEAIIQTADAVMAWANYYLPF